MESKRSLLTLAPLPARSSALWGAPSHPSLTFIQRGGRGLLLALVAWLLGGCELLFSTYPLGLALLAASSKQLLFILAGLAVAAFTSGAGGILYLAACVACLCLRVLTRLALDNPEGASLRHMIIPDTSSAPVRPLFGENPYLRMTAAAVCTFLLSLNAMITGGFRYYDLFGALFSLAVAPLATLLYAGLEKKEEPALSPESSLRARAMRLLSMGALLFSLTLATRSFAWFGVSPAVVLTFVATLYLSRHHGTLTGSTLGLLCGLIYQPRFAPLFALAGILSGGLFSLSPLLSGMASCLAGLLWGFYVAGLEALDTLTPSLIFACGLYLSCEKLLAHKGAPVTVAPSASLAQANRLAAADCRLQTEEERLQEGSRAFLSVSRLLYDLSEQLRRPTLPDLRRACDAAFDAVCPRCEHRQLCWEREYHESAGALHTLAVALHTRGFVEEADMPASMAARCAARPTLLQAINQKGAHLTEQAIHGEKTELFAMDFEAFSTFLSQMNERSRAEEQENRHLSAKLGEHAEALGLGGYAIAVLGGRKKTILLRAPQGANAPLAPDLTQRLSTLCGYRLGASACGEENTASYTILPALAVDGAFVSEAADGGRREVCGDSVVTFEDGEGHAYALLSDGMGSGNEAAFTSTLCTLFLQRLLSAGCPAETALRLLNTVLRSKRATSSGECSATVDLFSLDLLDGRAEWIKCGAAPSFVLREGQVFKLRSKTVPIGILRELDAKRIAFRAEAGDTVILLSDGLTQNDPECEWLTDLAAKNRNVSPARLGEMLIEHAKGQGMGDDLSVAVLKLTPPMAS